MTEALTPPGPRGDFLLGSVLDFKEHPLHFIRYVAQAYGDVSRFKMGPTHWYLLTHPEHIWDVMTKRGDVFLKPQIARRLWEKFLGDGLLTIEGDTWKRMNKLVKPAFRRTRIRSYGEVMTDFTHRMLDRWQQGARLDLDAEMVSLTLEIVAKTLFNADVREGAETFGKAMEVLQEAMVEHILAPVPVPRWWPTEKNRRKLQAIKDIEEIVWRVIEERRAEGVDQGDLLSMMLLAQDESGQGLTDKEVRDQSMTIFFAGHETTAHAMTWAWYLLARNPHVVERLQADLEAVTGGERLTIPHLNQLPYLEQTVKESLRFLPSVWLFIKEPIVDAVVGGYKIPKGAPVLISPYVTHHDPRWYPSPETFDPDRFSPEREAALPKGAYIPFSGGARICLGKHFAMMEAMLVLGSMLQRLEPRVPEEYQVCWKSELSLHPDGPLPIDVVFRDRNPGQEVAAG